MRSLRGCGDLSVIARQKYTWALSVLFRTLLPEGMAYGRAKFGSIVPTAACRGGVHIGGVASGVSTPQASEVGMPCCQGAQCGVVLSHPRSGHTCVVHVRVWVLLKVELCVVSSQKSVVYWQGTCQSYTLSRSGCTSHFRCLCRAGLKVVNNPLPPPGIDFPGASYGVFVSSHRQSFPPSLRPQLPKHWQYRWRSDGQCEGCCERAAAAAQGREREGPCASEKAVVFIPYHPKEFSGAFSREEYWKMSRESSTMLLVACVEFAKREARGGCGSSIARGPFETFTPRSGGLCRCAGAAQPAGRAGSLATAGVGAG